MSDTGAGKTDVAPPATAQHRAYYGDDPKYEAKIKARERAKFTPELEKAIYGRKYVLPNYRQPDYYDQHLANQMSASALLIPFQVDKYDDVMNAAFSNVTLALSCGRPQFWLEKELAQAFMRADLPEDMCAPDIKWRYPGFRIHLPKGIMPLGDQWGHDLMFMDICLVPGYAALKLPKVYLEEIKAIGKEYGWPPVEEIKTKRFTQHALMISGNVNCLDDSAAPYIGLEAMKRGDLMLYSVIKPFDEAVRLGMIRKVNSASDKNLSSDYLPTPLDNDFCERILHLALNVLLCFGAAPLEYQPEETLRKPRTEGRHHIPGLYAARFVGASLLRPVRAKGHSVPTGRHLPHQWRCGHWKRQVCGPKFADRKLLWIDTYQTTGEGYEEK